MAKQPRLKLQAEAYVPQTSDDCARDIARIGAITRELTRYDAEMNDKIAEITSTYAPLIESLKEQIKPLQAGVQVWCEANRNELTRGGKVKTADFVTGQVQWRQRPPSVSVRGADAVIERLITLNLVKYLRLKREINKDAILAEPDAVRGVPGITVITGVEDFVIVPAEIDVD